MESGQIRDSQINSSSQLDENTKGKVRLNLEAHHGSWCAAIDDKKQWLAVDLITNHMISAVSAICLYI